MITKDRNYRSFSFETVEGDMIVRGMPVVLESPTVMFVEDGIEYKELIAKDALNDTDIEDVVFNIDHIGKPAAKTKNGTLALESRDDGLYMQADLSKNETGRELYEDIKNGFYDKMSFAFSIEDEEYDKETHTRYIKKIKKIYDVSAVTFPAYSNTTISARSFFEAEAAKELKAKELAELRKKLLIKTYL